MMKFCSSAALPALVLCISAIPNAFAAATYKATAQVAGSFYSESATSPGVQVQEGGVNGLSPRPMIDYFFTARAGKGSVAAAVRAQSDKPLPAAFEVNAGAEFVVTDLVFSSAMNETINVSLPLDISGTIIGTPTLVSLSVSLTGNGTRSGFYRNDGTAGTGLLASFGPSTTSYEESVQVATFSVATNIPLRFAVELGTQLFASTNLALVDFANTINLVSDGPTFIVPEGIDVNSEQLGVVNNQFHLVPLPAPLALFGAGALLLLGCTKGARRRVSD